MVRVLWLGLLLLLSTLVPLPGASAGLGDPLRGVNPETFCEEHGLDLFGACIFAPGNMGAEVDNTCTGQSNTMRILRAVLQLIGVGFTTNAVIVVIGQLCAGGELGVDQAIATCQATAGIVPPPPPVDYPDPPAVPGVDARPALDWSEARVYECWA